MARHLHDTLPFLINRIAARVSEAVNQQFQPLGLNVFAVRVLILLHLEGPLSVGELAEQAALEQSTLSHILRRLEAQGHLRKERQPHDNRSVLVSLTQQGKPIAAHCWVAVQRHDVLLRQGVDAKAVELLKEVLNQLYANVPAFQQPGERPVDPAAPNEPVKDVPAAAEVRSRKPRRA